MQKRSHCWGSSRRTGAGSLGLQRTHTKLGLMGGGGGWGGGYSPNSSGCGISWAEQKARADSVGLPILGHPRGSTHY